MLNGFEFRATPAAGVCLHEVEFYSDDAALVHGFARFVAVALEAGNAAVVAATKPHLKAVTKSLNAQSVDIDSAFFAGRLIFLDASETLSTLLMSGGMPDESRFFDIVGRLIEEAAKAAVGKRARVAACAECAFLLWEQGKTEAAIRLEQLWDQLTRTQEVDVLCAYPRSVFELEKHKQVLERICMEHSIVRS